MISPHVTRIGYTPFFPPNSISSIHLSVRELAIWRLWRSVNAEHRVLINVQLSKIGIRTY